MYHSDYLLGLLDTYYTLERVIHVSFIQLKIDQYPRHSICNNIISV